MIIKGLTIELAPVRNIGHGDLLKGRLAHNVLQRRLQRGNGYFFYRHNISSRNIILYRSGQPSADKIVHGPMIFFLIEQAALGVLGVVKNFQFLFIRRT